MRRLLIVVAILALNLGLAAPALASNRVPSKVKQVTVTLTFPPRTGGSKPPVHRTLTKTATVNRVIKAVDALKAAQTRHTMCPMIEVLGPKLTVVFRAGGAGPNPALAEAQVDVALGTHGSSGSSLCFPIHFSAGSTQVALIGNSFVRLVGGLIGTPIS
ncbi:MAG TPA: hypothetical protein VHV75_09215 [Solirubrobacteraceae bacterium]|jgi:hypothetical protein|nr:hypothetical protein [Solirubrobacteraceae bacterium]